MAKVHNTENVRERETSHIEEIVPKLPERSVPTLWDASAKQEPKSKMRVKFPVKRLNLRGSPKRLGSIAPQLFNLDSSPETEKPLGVKLDLHQMENF